MHHAILGDRWRKILKKTGNILSKGLGVGLKIAGAIEPELAPITVPLSMANRALRQMTLCDRFESKPK